MTLSICSTPCISYGWDLGDGTKINAVRLQHVYQAPAEYNVTLTVTDDQARSGTATTRIQIRAAAPAATATPVPTPAPDQPPVAVINAPSQAEVGQPVTFDASQSVCVGACVTYGWQFGDGATAEAVVIDHVYGAPGLYNVTLNVIDDQGLTGTSSQQIQVSATPPPTPEPEDTSTPEPEPPTPEPEPDTPTPEATTAPPPEPTTEPTSEP